jgi:glycerophosphoryl diester phosphodiesterase
MSASATVETRPAGTRIIAHRGASHAAPENTLAAFRLAWEEGADGIEADFRLTRDRQVVASHDATGLRTTGADLPVAGSTLEELRRLDAGAWKGERWAGERIPTLQEVLAVVLPGKQIFLEIKGGPEMVTILLAALDRSGLAPGQAVVISFDERVIAEVKRLAPNRKVCWLVDFRQKQETGTQPCGRVGARQTAPVNLERAGNTVRGRKAAGLFPSAQELLEVARRIRADGVDLRAHPRLDAMFVKAIRDAGRELHVWTVNDLDTALHFRSLGVDSMTTDRPAWLRKALRRREG